jgi:hypothetical protein
MAFDQVNAGTHGRYPLPVGMVLHLMPTGPGSSARATSSVSGLGTWSATDPILIGPFGVFTEIVVEVVAGVALVDAVFATGSAPVTVTGTAGIGNTLTAALAPGWVATSFQWKRDGVPIDGETSSTHLQTNADGGHAVTVGVSGLIYTPPGINVPGGGISVQWDDTQSWDDTATWMD